VYLTTAFKDVMVFGLLILLLLVRPSGLFGHPTLDRV
jgi:branched-subunit amino acid ABC-type transport system permease component